MTTPWFRLYHRMIDDWKIRSLAFEDRWHFVALLCLKCSGDLDSEEFNDRTVGIKLGVQGVDLEGVKCRLMELKLIDEFWQPINWHELQFQSDSSRDRVKKFRENQRHNQVKRYSNVTVTPQDTDTDTDTDTDQDLARHFASESDAPSAPNSKKKKDDTPYDTIVGLYNDILGATNPTCIKLTDKRKRQIRARYEDMPELENWERLFHYVKRSKFLTGRRDGAKGSAFKANLEWITNESNFLKIEEGQYDD